MFSEAFIPGSIQIGLNEFFEDLAGALIKPGSRLVFLSEEGREEEVVARLQKAGHDNIIGFVGGGIESWKEAGEEIDMLIGIEADELAMDLPFDDHLVVIDVRLETEFAEGHVKDAVNIPLKTLADPGSMAMIEDADNLYLHCATGLRSTTAASLMKRQGLHNIRIVTGGWAAIRAEKRIEIAKERGQLN